MHRMSGPVQGGVMSERWFDGIWIGLQFTSVEHMVATSDGRVVRARAVHPRPDTVKITKEALNNIRGGPWSPSEVITQESGGSPPQWLSEPSRRRPRSQSLGASESTRSCWASEITPRDAANARHCGEVTIIEVSTTV